MRLLNKVGVGGSERPAGASRAIDADSAPEACSSLAETSSTKSSTVTITGIAEEAGYRTVRMTVRVKVFHGTLNWYCRKDRSTWLGPIGGHGQAVELGSTAAMLSFR